MYSPVACNRTRARTYQLDIEVGRPLRIAIGRLGEFDFPAGRYVYSGSARRGLDARVRRHLSGAKRLHWHIDYLLAMPGVRITGVSTTDEPECTANQRTSGAIVVQGFGSSDCTSDCGSNLKLVARQRPGNSRQTAKTRPRRSLRAQRSKLVLGRIGM
jgi:Uri superfamily endonuclease